jgi:hypothetical protein
MTAETCHFCDEVDRLQQHHIVPRRFNGSDTNENIVTVCPTCHDKLEDLYDKRFYDTLGVKKTDSECDYNGCYSTDTTRYKNGELLVHVCDTHAKCVVDPGMHSPCTKSGLVPVYRGGGVVLVCGNHNGCNAGDCGATAKYIRDAKVGVDRFCEGHAEGESVV